MVNYLARLLVADNSGVSVVQCINLLGNSKSSVTSIGNLVVVITNRLFTWSSFKNGLVVRGLIVRSCLDFIRGGGVWVSFGHNAVILVNNNNAPLANRLNGPFVNEMCINYNLLGTVTSFLV